MRASGSTVPLSVLKFRMTNSCWTGSASEAAACACANCSPKITTIDALNRTAPSQYFRSPDYDAEAYTIIVASDSRSGNPLSTQRRRAVEAVEYALHGGHALYIRACRGIPATLAFGQSESSPRKLIARPRAAQVYQRGEHLLLRGRRGAYSVAVENGGDA